MKIRKKAILLTNILFSRLNLKKKILFILLIICPALFLSLSLINPAPDRASLNLSQKEKERVEKTFKHFFFFDQFAFTLFGSKPVSIGVLLPKYQKGWNAWKKVESHFKSKNFIIREYGFKNHRFVLVANLKEVERVYRENEELFGGMNLETLKECLQKDGPIFQDLLNNDVRLGVLLGYGKRNAQLYAEGLTKKKNLLQPFSKGHPILYLFSPVMPPFFACDPNSPETIELKNRYREEKNHISEIAKKENLFSLMVSLLND